MKQYTADQMEQIQEFINRTFGNGDEGIIGHELVSEFVHTDVAIVDTPEEDRCFVTFGMAAGETNAPIAPLRRTELLMYTTKAVEFDAGEARILMEELQSLSKYPFRNDTFFGPGHTIAASELFEETFGFGAFVLAPAQTTQISGVGDVLFLLVIPIYQEEREAMMEGDPFDVLALLEDAFGEKIYYADSGREKLTF